MRLVYLLHVDRSSSDEKIIVGKENIQRNLSPLQLHRTIEK